MSEHFVQGVTLKTIECYRCAMVFAMAASFYDRRVNDRETWYCPAGHPQHFNGLTAEQKLRDELERQRQMLEAEQARAASMRRERDRVAKAHSRMRRRVMNGVCPCCNRTFQNLLEHMKTQHSGELNLANVRQAFGMTQEDVARETGVSQAQVSSFERGRSVSAWAGSRLESWLEKQAAES